VVERHSYPRMITFFSERAFAAGDLADLGEAALHHARVRRVAVGAAAHVLDGHGSVGQGRVHHLSKARLVVQVDTVAMVARPGELTVFVPVADRDRVLIAAEKCAELQITRWQPVVFDRSRSVSPRGEGKKFRERVRARMVSALEQSGGAWLPDIQAEISASELWTSVASDWNRVVLDSRGTSMAARKPWSHNAIAAGPEGGLSDSELADAEAAGWERASIGNTTLRFETALIAGVAIVRSNQGASQEVRSG